MQLFVDASRDGWLHYLENPGPGNALIKRDNPDITDAILAQALDKMKRYEMLISGDGRAFGLGSMSDAQWKLFYDTMASEELSRVRQLFEELESREGLIELLGDTEQAQGVKIFIGSENKLFSLSGSSVILSPYKDANQKVVGVLGVIGPTRLNYARIVPVVDYTANVVSAMMARKV